MLAQLVTILAAAVFSCAMISAAAGAEQVKGKRVADTRFSHRSGFYSEPFTLAIDCKTEGARIYFTTNGSAPTEKEGRLYEGPIAIGGTTILRVAAFHAALEPSNVDSRTFLFLRDVLRQSGAGFPDHWGEKDDRLIEADYEMDPEMVAAPSQRGEMEAALKSIATLLVVMEPSDLFGAERGIYSHSEKSGADWERPAAIELLLQGGERAFKIRCGIRIQGGWNRRPEESPKHAFRLVFRKKYGPGKLDYPVFGEAGAPEFETLILRSGNNNSWLHWSGEERHRADFIRDQWMRDSYLEMGRPSARGIFVHLYLNGMYWGLYNLTERPDEHFAAANLGGSSEQYDVRNGDKILSGDQKSWDEMLARANAGVQDGRGLADIQRFLDLPAFIDFMIVNYFGANADWDRVSNWYAARRRSADGRWVFFVWDAERTLERIEDSSLSFDDDQSPPRLFHKLKENVEFRVQFADRVQRHFFGSGVLTPRSAAERFQKRAWEIESAVLGESARWGDYRRDVHPYKTGPYLLYTRDQHWRAEIDRLLSEYFPNRTASVLKQFREAGLFPSIDAPRAEISGRQVRFASNESVYFTTDGTDPRREGGQLSDKAESFSAVIVVSPGQKVAARSLRGAPGAGEWSAKVELEFPK
ncbi:MAG: CotH kinase family protein [Verrucomicrobiota bacterium]